MDYIKLGTRYYRDPALQAANDRTRGQAEVLFLRGLAQCGADESEGYVPRSSLTFLGVKNAEKVAAVLVEEKLWEPADAGWRYRSWDKWQSEHDALARRKKADRERQARRRQKGREEEPPPDEPGPQDDSSSRDRPQTRSRDESRDVTPPRGEERKTGTDLRSDLATSDADEAHTFERTPAQHLAARYAAGVPLSKHHGQAMRTLGTALDLGYDPAMLERAVDVLIAEQRQCTPDTLRIAIGAAPGNWGTAVRPASNTSHLDDLRNAGPGVAEAAFRRLFAVPDGDHADPDLPALEA